MKLMRNMLVLAIAQAGLGAPGVPTAAANAILCRTAMPSILSAEFVQRQLLKGFKGNFGTIVAGEHRTIEFEVEMASVGAAQVGTSVPYAPLLLGSGFNETLTPGVDAQYALVNGGEPYLTIYAYLDGVLFQLQDAKLTVSAELTSKQIPVWKFRAMGKYVAMTDAVLPPGADFSKFIKPRTVGKVNTPTFNIHGVPAKMQSLSWDLANELQWRDLVNEQGAVSTDRRPTGRAVFELPSVATKDWGEVARLGTEAALQLIHGPAAGEIVQHDMPKVAVTGEPTLSDANGIVMVTVPFSVNPALGNDELVLTFK